MGKAKEKLKRIQAIVDDATGTASADMTDPPSSIVEIGAILDGTSCEECGNPGWARLMMGVSDHYVSCSKYKS